MFAGGAALSSATVRAQDNTISEAGQEIQSLLQMSRSILQIQQTELQNKIALLQNNAQTVQDTLLQLNQTLSALKQVIQAEQTSAASVQQSLQPIMQVLYTLDASVSCPVFAGQGTLLGEDSCVWARVTGHRTDQYATDGAPGNRVDDMTYALGGQKEFAPSWFLGGSFAAATTWTHDDSGGTGNGQIFDGSIALKHTIGPWLFAGAIALGTTSDHHNSPPTGLPSVSSLQSNSNAFFAGARFRAAYDFAFANWYVRPRADLDIIYTHLPGFQASGQSGFAVALGGLDKISPVMTPMVEFGGRYDIDQTTILRPYLAVGLSIFPNNTTTTNASLIIDGATLGTLQTSLKSSRVIGIADIGVQLYRVSGFEVKAEYDVRAANAYLSQSVSLRGAYHF